ncbi:MAG: MMPL family transporter [Clostridium sp.]|nr:MMPL family transporter [uncultured Intestinibacter sp.]
MPELDNNALFTVTVDEQTRLETVNAIRKLIGDENSMSGSAVNTAVATQATNSEIKKIISYVYSAGAEVPMDYVESDVLNKLISKNYSRMVLTVDAVFLVLLITMKSISIPIILVLAIETAIWINLSIPYFSGNFLFYISYLIISSVQLGATVDYAILFTTRYLENRKVLPKRESIVDTIKTTTVSIMRSASILTLAGVLLWKISTHGVLSQLGHLLGRGTVLSTIIVLFVIPGMLYIFDTLIRETTVGANFYEGKPEKKKSEKREIKEVKESY